MTSTIRLQTPLDLASCVPSVLGFEPDAGSIILLAMTDQGRKFGMALRVDYPAPDGSGRILDALARNFVAALGRGEPDTHTVHVIGWKTALGEADELYWRLANAGAPWVVGECFTVQQRDGQLMALDTCAESVDPQWQPLPSDKLEPAVIVELGQVKAGSRRELADRIVPSGADPSPVQTALLNLLRTFQGRDALLLSLAGASPDELAELQDVYTATARVGRGDGRSGALCLVALTAYLLGDGAMTNIALEACPRSYSLANLLQTMLDATVPPTVVKQWLGEMAL